MHLNSVQLIGRISKNGPKLSYGSSGSPTCSFTLEVDERTKTGDIFTTFIPVEIWGQAEAAAETLEPGDEVQLMGKWKYKSTVDRKTQEKTSKPIVSCWGVTQRIAAPTSMPQDETSAPPEGEDSPREDASPQKAPRRRRYPKAFLQGGFAER